jgi:hypothetical protein
LQLLNKRSPDSLLIEPIFLLMDRRLQPYRAEAEAAMDSEMAALASDARRLGFRCLFIAIPTSRSSRRTAPMPSSAG